MLDEDTKAMLHGMKAKALHKAHEAMEDGDYDKCGTMIDIYRDIDHVCRKHWLMEHMPQTAMK